MPERKSLSAGIGVVPPGVDIDAVRAFVKQDTHRPMSISEPSEWPETSSAEFRSETNSTSGKKTPLVSVGLIPVTVRLKPETASALKRASLERQLAGEEPHTQQEIVEQALKPWLRKHC